MATKKRNVELFRISFNATDKAGNAVLFEDFLNTYIHKHEIDDGYKNLYFQVLRNKRRYIVVGITTTKMYGIPPKNDVKTHKTDAIQLDPDEGLGYSNVFLYDKDYKVIYYEHSQNGLWYDTFFGLVQGMQLTKHCPCAVSMAGEPVLRKESYQRIIDFGFYHKIEMKIAYPDDMVISEKAEKSAILKTIAAQQGSGMEALELTYSVDARKLMNSLDVKTIRAYVSTIKDLIGSRFGGHVKKFKVKGLAADASGKYSKGQSIDLAKDKFTDNFRINEPRVRTDLQLSEKTDGIISVYRQSKEEVKSIFSKKK